MSHVGYLVAGWTVGLGGLGLYAAWMIARGRTLTRQLPPARRRWIDSPNQQRPARR
jgi:hypothetical protein